MSRKVSLSSSALSGFIAMLLAHWFTEKIVFLPVECAELGGCELRVCFINGEWQWLVRHAGRDVDEGSARACLAAKQQAEDAALRLLDLVVRAARCWQDECNNTL
jgi:hypothetical protein